MTKVLIWKKIKYGWVTHYGQIIILYTYNLHDRNLISTNSWMIFFFWTKMKKQTIVLNCLIAIIDVFSEKFDFFFPPHVFVIVDLHYLLILFSNTEPIKQILNNFCNFIRKIVKKAKKKIICKSIPTNDFCKIIYRILLLWWLNYFVNFFFFRLNVEFIIQKPKAMKQAKIYYCIFSKKNSFKEKNEWQMHICNACWRRIAIYVYCEQRKNCVKTKKKKMLRDSKKILFLNRTFMFSNCSLIVKAFQRRKKIRK